MPSFFFCGEETKTSPWWPCVPDGKKVASADCSRTFYCIDDGTAYPTLYAVVAAGFESWAGTHLELESKLRLVRSCGRSRLVTHELGIFCGQANQDTGQTNLGGSPLPPSL